MGYIFNSENAYGAATAVVVGDLSVTDIAKLLIERPRAVAFNTATGWSGKGINLLPQLTFLEQLDILPNEPTSIDSLAPLPQLRRLFLGSNCVGKLDLKNVPQLVSLAFNDAARKLQIVNADAAELLVTVSGNATQQLIDRLSSAPSLRRLFLANPRFEALDWLGGFDLVALGVNRGTKLKSLKNVTTKSRLKFLKFQDCRQLISLEGLDSFPNLEFLMFDECGGISSLTPLAALNKLKLLSFNGDTNIRDGVISVIDCCTTLAHTRFVDRKHYDMSMNAYSFDQQYFGEVVQEFVGT